MISSFFSFLFCVTCYLRSIFCMWTTRGIIFGHEKASNCKQPFSTKNDNCALIFTEYSHYHCLRKSFSSFIFHMYYFDYGQIPKHGLQNLPCLPMKVHVISLVICRVLQTICTCVPSTHLKYLVSA